MKIGLIISHQNRKFLEIKERSIRKYQDFQDVILIVYDKFPESEGYNITLKMTVRQSEKIHRHDLHRMYLNDSAKRFLKRLKHEWKEHPNFEAAVESISRTASVAPGKKE